VAVSSTTAADYVTVS